MNTKFYPHNASPIISIKCSNNCSTYTNQFSQKIPTYKSPSQINNPSLINMQPYKNQNDSYQLITDSQNKKLRLYTIKLVDNEYENAMKHYQLRQVNKYPSSIVKILYAGCNHNIAERSMPNQGILFLTVITEHVCYTLHNNPEEIMQRIYSSFPSFLIYLVEILKAYQQMRIAFGNIAVDADHFGLTQCGKIKIYFHKNLAMFKPDTNLYDKQNKIVSEIGQMIVRALSGMCTMYRECLNFLEKFVSFCIKQGNKLTFKEAINFIQSYPSISISTLANNGSLSQWYNPMLQTSHHPSNSVSYFNTHFSSPQYQSSCQQTKRQNSVNRFQAKVFQNKQQIATIQNSKKLILKHQVKQQPLGEIKNFSNVNQDQKKRMQTINSPPIRNSAKQENSRMVYSVRQTNEYTSPISEARSHKKLLSPKQFFKVPKFAAFQNIEQQSEQKELIKSLNYSAISNNQLTFANYCPYKSLNSKPIHKKYDNRNKQNEVKGEAHSQSNNRYPTQLVCAQPTDNKGYQNSLQQVTSSNNKKRHQITVGQFSVSMQLNKNTLKEIKDQNINIIEDVISKKLLKKSNLLKQKHTNTNKVLKKKQRSNFVPYQFTKNKTISPDLAYKKTINNHTINNQFNIVVHESLNATVRSSQAKNSMTSTSYNTCKQFNHDDNISAQLTDSIMISKDLDETDRTKTMRSLGRFQYREKCRTNQQRYTSPKLLFGQQNQHRGVNRTNYKIKQNKNSINSGEVKSIVPAAFRKCENKLKEKSNKDSLFQHLLNEKEIQSTKLPENLKLQKNTTAIILQKLRSMAIVQSGYLQTQVSAENQDIIKRMIQNSLNLNSKKHNQQIEKPLKVESQEQILKINNWGKKITKLVYSDQQPQRLQISLKQSRCSENNFVEKNTTENSFPNFKDIKVKVTQSVCGVQEFFHAQKK